MQITVSILKCEEGSLIPMVLLIMAVFTIIGITATNNTVTEQQIVRNEAIYKRNLFKAEAAAMEAVQRLENEDLDDTPPVFLQPTDTIEEDDELPDDETWEDDAEVAASIDPEHTTYLAVSRGIDDSSSMAMGGARVHSYIIYGRDTEGGGNIIVGMGYTKPF